jgi:hypothetical protein
MQEGSMMLVRKKLEQCQLRLQGWDKRKFGNVEKEVEKKDKIISQMAAGRWRRESGKNKTVVMGNR